MWAAAVLAVIKAVPAARDIFIQVVDLWHEAQDAAAESNSIKVMREREATVAAMRALHLTNEQRAVLRRRLWELHKL